MLATRREKEVSFTFMKRHGKASAEEITVAKLKMRLQSGRFNGVMPSERELSRELAAGRDTIRKALAQLQEEGLIAAPEKNRVRQVIRALPETLANLPKKHVCFLSSLPLRDLPQSIWVELHELGTALRAEGMELQLMEVPWTGKDHSEHRLRKMEASACCCCWILYRTTEEVQLWFKKKGIPCLVRGISYPSSRLPYLDTHWEVLVRHAAGYLHQKGHRRVALCIPASKLMGNSLMEKGLLSFQGEKWVPHLIRMPEDAAQAARALDRAFLRDPGITALISTRGRMLVSIISWASSQARNIPGDISLLSLVDEPYIRHVTPPITSYRQPTDKTTRRLIRMIEALVEQRRVSNSLIIPELCPGGSVQVMSRGRIEPSAPQ